MCATIQSFLGPTAICAVAAGIHARKRTNANAPRQCSDEHKQSYLQWKAI